MKKDPLLLHLMFKYWDMVYVGDKTHEFRPYTDYWRKRINCRDQLILVRGFPKNNVPNILVDIIFPQVVRFDDLPDYAKVLFDGVPHKNFYDIEFEIKKFNLGSVQG